MKGRGTTFLVRIAPNINPTRRMVMDVSSMDYLEPATQVFPDFPLLEQPASKRVHVKAFEALNSLFPDYKTKGNSTGKLVTTDEAIHLLSFVKTKGKNKWRDKHMPSILRDLATELGDGIHLQFRPATRGAKFATEKFESGALNDAVVQQNAVRDKPTLWLFDTKIDGLAENFVYPTLVIPRTASFIIFNRGRRG